MKLSTIVKQWALQTEHPPLPQPASDWLSSQQAKHANDIVTIGTACGILAAFPRREQALWLTGAASSAP